MSITIKHLDGHVLATVENVHNVGVVIPEGTNLRGANFQGMTLASDVTMVTTFGVATYLRGWILDKVDLAGADFSGADLSKALFRNANLTGAKFDGARLNFCSHDVTSEIFRQAATTPDQRDVATHNITHREWRFEQFAEAGHPEWRWAMSVLRGFVRPGERIETHIANYLAEPTDATAASEVVGSPGTEAR